MTVKELRTILEQLGPEHDQDEVIFGSCYPTYPVQDVEEIYNEVILSI